MVVEFVSFMASNNRFWFIVILQVKSQGIHPIKKSIEKQHARAFLCKIWELYPKSPHKNNPVTTLIVRGGRFFLQKSGNSTRNGNLREVA
jgi:hypothetical protein